jgi:hypothetical protein
VIGRVGMGRGQLSFGDAVAAQTNEIYKVISRGVKDVYLYNKA